MRYYVYMKIKKLTKRTKQILSGVIIITVFAVGVVMGSSGAMAKSFNRIGLTTVAASITPYTQPEGIDFGPVWKAWRILDSRFVDAYATSTEATSTDATTTDATTSATSTEKYQKRVWGLISGLTDSMGDPYTVFLPPSESKIFNADISGSFEGVGMEIVIRDRVLTVVSPLKDTPAFNAGIKAGDMIVKIDGKTTKDMSIREAVSRIRGEKGTKVSFDIVRKGVNKILKISVVRDTIQIPTIKTKKRADGIFVIELLNFSAKSASLFADAIQEFQKSRYHNLIIDLRGNPGGYLSAAVDIASWFMPAGKIVVTEDYAGHGENNIHRSRGHMLQDSRLKVVVLIDKGSASAAEILSGSLQAHKAATIIGTNSFGKGSVQEVIPLTPNTSLKVTVARWLLAGNKFIGHNGITPDIEVKYPKEPKDGVDYIMDRAVRYIHDGK